MRGPGGPGQGTPSEGRLGGGAHDIDVDADGGQCAAVQVAEQAPPTSRTISASTRPGVTPCSRRTVPAKRAVPAE